MLAIGDRLPTLVIRRGKEIRSDTSAAWLPRCSLRPISRGGRLAASSRLRQRTDMSRLEFVRLVGAWLGGTLAILVLSLGMRWFW